MLEKSGLFATISGSFRKHLHKVQEAYTELEFNGWVVLSPERPSIRGNRGEFVYLEGDSSNSVYLTQSRHFDAIRGSHFVWVVCPGGYVGRSTAMEIGFAKACGVPCFSDTNPSEPRLSAYVQRVSKLSHLFKGWTPKSYPDLCLLKPTLWAARRHAEIENMNF